MDQTVTEPLHLISKHFVGPTPAEQLDDLRRQSQNTPLGSDNKPLSLFSRRLIDVGYILLYPNMYYTGNETLTEDLNGS